MAKSLPCFDPVADLALELAELAQAQRQIADRLEALIVELRATGIIAPLPKPALTVVDGGREPDPPGSP
jgi:hypothetical protein